MLILDNRFHKVGQNHKQSQLDNYECPKYDQFSKISSETEGSKDFKEYCSEGERCGSSTSTVKFKQCYAKR